MKLRHENVTGMLGLVRRHLEWQEQTNVAHGPQLARLDALAQRCHRLSPAQISDGVYDAARALWKADKSESLTSPIIDDFDHYLARVDFEVGRAEERAA